MSLSPILGITRLIENQYQKSVTSNMAFDDLEQPEGFLDVATNSGTLVLTADQAQYGLLRYTGVLTADQIIELPSGLLNSNVHENATTGNFTLRVRVTGDSVNHYIPRACSKAIRRTGSTSVVNGKFAPNMPCAQIYRGTSDITNFASGSQAKVALNTADFDPAGLFDSTNNRLNIPADGLYCILANLRFTVLASTPNPYISIFKNGALLKDGVQFVGVSGVTEARLTAACIAKLNRTDYIELFAIHSSGANATIKQGLESTSLALFCQEYS